uniref:Uncharacterized protein n=1 Tax=Cyprinus carpio carpio TaxID=630221 RepID=A0A9J7ZTX8_CYPCA
EITIQHLFYRGHPLKTAFAHRLDVPDPSVIPMSSFSSMPQQQRVLNRRKQMAAPLSSKRETNKSGAFSLKNAHNACRLLPQGHCMHSHHTQQQDQTLPTFKN